MAKVFKKSILSVGLHKAPDGEVEVTPSRIRHWAREFRRMKDAGLVVPIDWDHGSRMEDLSPVSLSQFKKRTSQNTVGRLVDVRPSPDGRSVEFYHELRTPKAIEQAELNNVFVSPVILPSFRDGAGNEYHDLIGHADLVVYPVDHTQSEFEPVEPGTIAMSLRQASDSQAVRMGSDDPADGFFTKGGKVIPITVGGKEYLDDDHQPAKPSKKFKGAKGKKKRKGKRMSINPKAVRMSDDDRRDEDELDEELEDETDLEGGYEDDDDDDDKVIVMEDAPPPEPVPDVAAPNIRGLLSALASHNIILPGDTDANNFFDRLHAALLTASAHKKEQEQAPPEEPEQPPAKVVDDTMGISQMSLQAKAAYNYADRQHRSGVQKKLKSLLEAGQCTPAEYRDWEQQARAVKLSLGANGEPTPSKVEEFIKSREAVPKGTFWSSETRTRMSAVVNPPAALRGDLTPEEINDVAGWALGVRK
mgnify:FL=1